MDYLTTRTSLSPILWHGFAPGFVNYKKGCTRLAATSDKVYQLLARGRWFSPGTPAFSTTKTGRHDIVEILLKVALNTINHQIVIWNKFSQSSDNILCKTHTILVANLYSCVTHAVNKTRTDHLVCCLC